MPESTNARIAREVMGWKLCLKYWGSPIQRCYCTDDSVKHRDEVPDFEASRDACALAEAEIERRGLASVYLDSLEDMRFSEIASGREPVTLRYFLLRLTPTQRCAAMLAAIGGGHA